MFDCAPVFCLPARFFPLGVVFVALLFHFIILKPDFLCTWVLDLISHLTEPALFREPTQSAPESAPFREPTQSAPFREPTQSVPGAHVVCSRARSGPGTHRLRSRARSGPGAHAVRSVPRLSPYIVSLCLQSCADPLSYVV